VRWYVNTLVVCTATAILTVLLSALAAYAFSRFRFRGRRFGLVGLLLIQMFPSLLLVVALYLIVLHVGSVFTFFGLNKLTTLTIVYLGGVLGVNTWLMKGFFDSIPRELDESARVDGATPAQVFWGVILPLAVPVLAVIGLFSFIGVLNEFAIAAAILQTTNKFTLSVGLFGFVSQEYGRHWGPFAAGVVLAAIPAALLFAFLQRYIVSGLTQGAVKG
jgi:arabinogalactan oligomer/maltooligosaccharide transport system permease protein